MSLRPAKPKSALIAAILIWISGFVWGSIVFMTPSLKSAPPIRYISINPVISFPLLLLWAPLTFIFARRYLNGLEDKSIQGRNLGVVLSSVNFLLDLLVLVLLLRAGYGFFKSLTVWLAYSILLLVPWLTGIHLTAATSDHPGKANENV
jgi:hypothetical protein